MGGRKRRWATKSMAYETINKGIYLQSDEDTDGDQHETFLRKEEILTKEILTNDISFKITAYPGHP